jgi:putative exporter of polyketide antibiotics
MRTVLHTLVKIAIASLIVGTILAHFGITLETLGAEAGISMERVQEQVRESLAWALPNLLLGSIVIVPIWFLVYILRPPGPSSD